LIWSICREYRNRKGIDENIDPIIKEEIMITWMKMFQDKIFNDYFVNT